MRSSSSRRRSEAWVGDKVGVEVGVEDRSRHELDVGSAEEMFDVRVAAGRETVEQDDLLAPGKQTVGEVEPMNPGYR